MLIKLIKQKKYIFSFLIRLHTTQIQKTWYVVGWGIRKLYSKIWFKITIEWAIKESFNTFIEKDNKILKKLKFFGYIFAGMSSKIK